MMTMIVVIVLVFFVFLMYFSHHVSCVFFLISYEPAVVLRAAARGVAHHESRGEVFRMTNRGKTTRIF